MRTIDISAAVHARAGLGRYAEQLAHALISAEPDQYALFYNMGEDGRFPPSLTPFNLPQRHVSWGYKPWRMAILLAQMGNIPFNRLVPDATLFHSTEHLLMPLRGIPTVLTVHDLIFKLFPSYHKKLNYWYLNWAMPIYCRKADAIITISQASKQDIVEQYKIDPAKIHVVYEAPSSLFQPVSPARVSHIRQTYQLPDRYLIHLSTIEPRKNLSRMLDVLKALRQRFPSLSLVLAGGKGWLTDDFFAKIEADGLSDAVQVLGWVPDEDLPGILAGAELAVHPSLYEGFGLPVLEHMASGQVVAASNRSSLPEVGGEAAVYFDPTNIEEMTTVIRRLLTDRNEYKHRQQLGIQQAQKFSWKRTAAETTAVYEKVLSK